MYLFQINTYILIGTLFTSIGKIMTLALVKLGGHVSDLSNYQKVLRTKIELKLIGFSKILTLTLLLIGSIIFVISFFKPEINSILIF